MYDLTTYLVNHPPWEFLTLNTGTGGSALIIGTAAGVAVMGIEQIEFIWYMKKKWRIGIDWICCRYFGDFIKTAVGCLM